MPDDVASDERKSKKKGKRNRDDPAVVNGDNEQAHKLLAIFHKKMAKASVGGWLAKTIKKCEKVLLQGMLEAYSIDDVEEDSNKAAEEQPKRKKKKKEKQVVAAVEIKSQPPAAGTSVPAPAPPAPPSKSGSRRRAPPKTPRCRWAESQVDIVRQHVQDAEATNQQVDLGKLARIFGGAYTATQISAKVSKIKRDMKVAAGLLAPGEPHANASPVRPVRINLASAPATGAAAAVPSTGKEQALTGQGTGQGHRERVRDQQQQQQERQEQQQHKEEQQLQQQERQRTERQQQKQEHKQHASQWGAGSLPLPAPPASLPPSEHAPRPQVGSVVRYTIPALSSRFQDIPSHPGQHQRRLSAADYQPASPGSPSGRFGGQRPGKLSRPFRQLLKEKMIEVLEEAPGHRGTVEAVTEELSLDPLVKEIDMVTLRSAVGGMLGSNAAFKSTRQMQSSTNRRVEYILSKYADW